MRGDDRITSQRVLRRCFQLEILRRRCSTRSSNEKCTGSVIWMGTTRAKRNHHGAHGRPCGRLARGASSVLCKRQFLFLAPQAIGAVEKWESWFWISTFPPPKSFSCVWRLFLISIGFLPRCVGPFGASRATPPSARAYRLMRYFIFSFRFYLSGYANASGGTRSPSRIAKRCKAAFQSCTGIVHFLAICSSARNSNFSAASAVGNDPLVLITLRSDMFSDSMAFVV